MVCVQLSDKFYIYPIFYVRMRAAGLCISVICAAALVASSERQPRAAGMLVFQGALLGFASLCVGRVRLDRATRSAYVGAAIAAYGCSLCEVMLCAGSAACAASLLGAPLLASILTATLEECALGPPAHPLLDDAPDACAVCLDACTSGQLCRRLLCGHCFHSSCIDPWAGAHASCPTCRAPLTN